MSSSSANIQPTPSEDKKAIATTPTAAQTQKRKAAEQQLEVGMMVQYTELVTGNRQVQQDRKKAPRVRAATVLFILDDGQQRRPVLRVMIPASPPMAEMPKEGRVHAGSASAQDIEIYGPAYDADPSVENTWRHLSRE